MGGNQQLFAVHIYQAQTGGKEAPLNCCFIFLQHLTKASREQDAALVLITQFLKSSWKITSWVVVPKQGPREEAMLGVVVGDVFLGGRDSCPINTRS